MKFCRSQFPRTDVIFCIISSKHAACKHAAPMSYLDQRKGKRANFTDVIFSKKKKKRKMCLCGCAILEGPFASTLRSPKLLHYIVLMLVLSCGATSSRSIRFLTPQVLHSSSNLIYSLSMMTTVLVTVHRPHVAG
jgi:hypothetical protein